MNTVLRASAGPQRPATNIWLYAWVALALGAVMAAAAMQTGIDHMILTWLRTAKSTATR